MPYDVFISYSSNDLKPAEEVYRRLTDKGFTVWFDRARLNPGFDWHKDIEDGCESSRIVVPIMTPRWKQSEWTKYETYGAESVIPLVVEGEWEDVNTPPLERFQAEKVKFSVAGNFPWDDFFNAIERLLNRPVPQRTVRMAKLRYLPNPFFEGRESFLIKLHEELHCRPRAILTYGRVRAIVGLGGVGKTTFVRHYAEKFWRCYEQIFWIDARVGYETEFARVHDILCPDQINVGLTSNQKAERALIELSGQSTRLLILDNVEDETSVQNWIPKSGGSHTLITSRFAMWSVAIPLIKLDVLESESAVRFLCNRIGHLSEDEETDSGLSLAKKLGHLPLALEQAAAYIDQQGAGFGFAEYIDLYEQRTQELLDNGALGSTEYPDSVITTWKSTVLTLKTGARTILRLLSLMAPTPLPLKVLIKGSHVFSSLGEDHKQRNQRADEVCIRREVGSLRAYSMINLEAQTLVVHPLVQAVEQFDMSASERDSMVKKCIGMIKHSTPTNVDLPQAWEVWRDLHPHALSIRTHFKNVDPMLRLTLLDAIARYEYGNARYNNSVKYEDEAYTLAEELIGLDSKEMDNSLFKDRLINYGESLRNLSRFDEAEKLFQKELAFRKSHRGSTHPSIATPCNYLGLLYRIQGRQDEALIYLREGLEICDRFGVDDQRTLVKLLLNLGIELITTQEEQAESYARRALKVAERQFGDDDLLTIFALEVIAAVVNNRGEYVEADSMFERVFESMDLLLGETHPETMNSLSCLATVKLNLGDTNASESLRRMIVERNTRCYGPHHTEVAESMTKLGDLLMRKQSFLEAKDLYQHSLEIYKAQTKLEPDKINAAEQCLSKATAALENDGNGS